MAAYGLNENHARSLLAGVQHAAKLLRDCSEIVSAFDRPSPLDRYTGELPAPKRRVAEDHLRRLHQQLLRFLATIGVQPPPPRTSALHALDVTLLFLDNTFEELSPDRLAGYGPVAPDAARVLRGELAELQARVREIREWLTGASADAVQAQLAALPPEEPLVEVLRGLDRIITTHGLVDLRSALALLVERATARVFEVAVAGRVSSGKSSLLNAVVGADVLPTGVLPMTAVPTRLRRGDAPVVHVRYADGREASCDIAELAAFVTEAGNPGNQRRVASVLVEHPSAILPNGVTFVDTPGLGSVAARGAVQTLAYLPRCDHVAYLLDAAAPMSPEDLDLLQFFHDAAISTSVVLSKADLLQDDELAQVEAYVRAELERRWSSTAPVAPTSVKPSHRHLLEAWMATEIAPLEREAAARWRAAVEGRAALLRAQCARLMEQRIGPSPAPEPHRDVTRVTRAIRDVQSAIERASRASHALQERRATVVRAILDIADEHGRDLRDVPSSALAAPARREAERVVAEIERIRADAIEALAEASRVAGAPPPASVAPPNEIPALDVPSFPRAGEAPLWTRLNAGLRVSWERDDVRARWEPALEQAVSAYLDLLRGWAGGVLAALRDEVEGQSRSLLALSAESGTLTTAASAPEAIEADLAWLRATRTPADA